ncbi:MAG: dTDP-4-dehydrorhamnose reductase [Solirubrobacterales bacterium]
MRALITGAAGQLGSDLEAILPDALARDHAALEITDEGAVETAIADATPEVVFNCAAYHNVDECERSEQAAARVNVEAVKRLAEACAGAGAKLVHFSTNYVFDGSRDAPYGEHDLPSPRSVYAITKLAGEHAALAYRPGALVVRTAGLYGRAGNVSKGGNFAQRMVARARSGEPIRMVSDQRLTPTFTADLAPAVVDALDAGAEGILHLTNAGACSWHEFTLAILAETGIEAEVEAVQTSRRPGTAERPLNGVLARPRADELGLALLRDWREALAEYLASAEL